MKTTTIARLICLVGMCLALIAWPTHAQEEETPSGYVGVYRLVSTAYEDVAKRTGAVFAPGLNLADMSWDGEFIAWTGAPEKVSTVFVSDFAGEKITAHPFGQDARNFWELAVGGRRAFVVPAGGMSIWLVESGGRQMILDATAEATVKGSGISQVVSIAATADGGWVYFAAGQGRAMGDVFSLPAAAGAPILVLARKDVPCPPQYHTERCDGAWGNPGWLDVSADAGQVVGVVDGFVTFNEKNDVLTHDWDEVLVFSGAGRRLITSDDQLGKTKEALAVSPDGSTVVFHSTVYASPNDKTGEPRWVAMDTDGVDAMRLLDPQFANLARPAMNADGSVALLDLSKLVRTDAGGELDLFTTWNVRGIALAATNNLALNQAGERVAFTVGFDAFYVGSINEPGAEQRAPIGITDVSLALGSAADELILTVSTTGPVTRVVVEPVRDSRLVEAKDAPWACPGTHDDGQAPDATAQDGKFTGLCKLKAQDTGGMRVGIATDGQGWAVVKDYPLFW